MAEAPRPPVDSREYLAAERTFLAYIRTGLALMAFGFVVARFSLFLREIAWIRQQAVTTPGLSEWFGTAFVLFGSVLNVTALLEYRRWVRRLNATYQAAWRPARAPVVTAALVALCGGMLAVYLIWVR